MRLPLLITAVVLGVATQAHALWPAANTALTQIPELDPQAGGAAFVLLAGAIAVLSSRRRARLTQHS